MNGLIGNIEGIGRRPLVTTVRERCMVCYTCVRECPGKAIKISNGQAEVVNARCIGCGNCIKVCSQKAKVYREAIDDVVNILENNSKVVALIAPSFPAEFQDLEDYPVLVGMIRKLGFQFVNEVAFGADLVAKKYRELILNAGSKRYISSDCPSIVAYIEKYHPNLVENLAPIASPMVAIARMMKKRHGEDTKLVFIGPCIAKKEESKEIDAVITFHELRKLFERFQVKPEGIIPTDFDAPKSGKGAIFPVSRGLVQTIDIQKEINEEDIIVADGRTNFQEAIKEFDSGFLKNQHLELLCCEGCVNGVGMSTSGKPFTKRALISNYVQKKMSEFDEVGWRKEYDNYKDLDISQVFHPNDTRMPVPDDERLEEVLNRMGKFNENQHLNCGACGYDTCREHAKAIINGLAEHEMCLPHTIERLHNSIEDLAHSNNKLASVRQALNHSEKLAHMGQLSAGVAHELNNPLGVIIMYANLLYEESGKDDENRKDLELIVQQAERCKNIVGGLLNFARKNKMRYESVDINELIETCTSSIIVPERIKLEITKKFTAKKIDIDKEQLVQGLSNLLKNAVEAISNEGKVDFIISESDSGIIFLIKDTGTGIKNQNMDKIFNPFFTTKEIGKGTGLGLATTYGIIKMHKGKITVTSNADKDTGPTGTTFRVVIPFNIMTE